MQADAQDDNAEPASDDAVRVTDWVIASGDNDGLPFIVIDKVGASVSVFDAEGGFVGWTPALLGIAGGDESTPGIGDRDLASMGPEERTTPAGRFLARYGTAPRRPYPSCGWIMRPPSRCIRWSPAARRERRLQRLRSPTSSDNRITYGCINVPAAFYAQFIRPLFGADGGIVYILPETRPVEELFPRLVARPNSAAATSLGRDIQVIRHPCWKSWLVKMERAKGFEPARSRSRRSAANRGFDPLLFERLERAKGFEPARSRSRGSADKTRGFDPLLCERLERAKGFEPSTPTLARLCSTPELRPLDWRNRASPVRVRRRLLAWAFSARQPVLSVEGPRCGLGRPGPPIPHRALDSEPLRRV